MQHLARLLVLAWLLANAWLFAGAGSDRVARDREIGRLGDPAARRSAIWGGEVGAALAGFEEALAAARPAERILLVAPRPRNVFGSLAEHLLFPARVELIEPALGLGPDEIRERALEIGASCAIFQDPSGAWRVMRGAREDEAR